MAAAVRVHLQALVRPPAAQARHQVAQVLLAHQVHLQAQALPVPAARQVAQAAPAVQVLPPVHLPQAEAVNPWLASLLKLTVW